MPSVRLGNKEFTAEQVTAHTTEVLIPTQTYIVMLNDTDTVGPNSETLQQAGSLSRFPENGSQNT